jgi:MFS family permease
VPASPAGNFNAAFVWGVSLTGALGGRLFGYDWVVIGGAKPFYESFFHLQNPLVQGWTISCALIGCVVGTLVSGRLTDRFGRKALLMMSAVIFCVSSLGTAFASALTVFIAWSIAGGFAIGLASSLYPMYIAEIAPAHQRGKLVALNQVTLVVGILSAQIANWKIADPVPAGATAATILNSWNGPMCWRLMFGVTAIPVALFFVAAVFLPECAMARAAGAKR